MSRESRALWRVTHLLAQGSDYTRPLGINMAK
jgi:hypothetical protein